MDRIKQRTKRRIVLGICIAAAAAVLIFIVLGVRGLLQKGADTSAGVEYIKKEEEGNITAIEEKISLLEQQDGSGQEGRSIKERFSGAVILGDSVAEGFEAGGHNGREETTTFCLIPAVKRMCTLPLIAAGGIMTGEGILAAQSLGADGVQMGTRFALTEESSAHFTFKDRCLRLNEGDTILTLKQLSPTRLVKNEFYKQVEEAESKGASADELRELLGKGRAKKGIFEGDMFEGELEIGQGASMIHRLQSVNEVMTELIADYNEALRRMQDSLSL